ncbi:DUF3089 domain-containing protein [Glaciecola petra]|uniref:DUF3089 domain-containing protein n=1 Tax=Glaciecola petra TaxID=3075602 RepID=A0ABU2ZVY3_9ALTE|nr:DUF3089 domain-containing protein [Aestuariibacter sp. P117]MDT0595582.1 DUF3089 domain-containing protein [Aestuariibacter sp. P117]
MKTFIKWLAILAVTFFLLGAIGYKFIEYRMLPSLPFVEDTVPQAPDYKNSDFWFAHPEIQDTADLIPANADTSQDIENKSIDVFFIHSTGYVGPGGWNSNMAHENSETQSLEYMLSSMASAFNGCCDIYAPNYRQAHLTAFSNEDSTSSFAALDLAYSDVESAFEYFIDNISNGRPFMIVAHSQGTLHGLRLIANKIDKHALRERLVAAYTIGYWLPKNMFERTFSNISLCESAEQTSCIVSYDTYGEGGAMSVGLRHWYPEGWETTQVGDIACVNPLSWNTNTAKVFADQHKGAFPVEFKRTPVDMVMANNPEYIFESLPDLSPNLTWAKCDESGVLHIAEQVDNAFSNHLNNADKSYHVLDFGLFYGNLRLNAIERSNAYLRKIESQ